VRRLANLAVVLAWACAATAPLADPAWIARPGSPFIEHTLDRPFAADLANAPFVVEVLRESGNEPEAELLERAWNRSRLARLAGGAYAAPRTVREAIAAERTAPPIAEAARAALARVRVEYSESREGARPGIPAEARTIGPAVSILPNAHGPSRVYAVFLVGNTLSAPLHRVSIESPGFVCEVQPPLHAGETRRVGCWSEEARDKLEGVARNVVARAVAAPFAIAFIETPLLVVTRTEAYLEGDGSHRLRARQQLASARCQDKGSCDALRGSSPGARRTP
jgi:hypothetical protein